MKKWTKGTKLFIQHDSGRLQVQTLNTMDSRTDQTQKDQCDIKNIMRKYGNKLQNVPTPVKGIVGDFSEIPSFQQMQDILNAGQSAFEALPAKLRKRFDNDPKEFMQFLADDTNNEEAYKLGLKVKSPSDKSVNNDNANQNAKSKKTKTENPSSETPAE